MQSSPAPLLSTDSLGDSHSAKDKREWGLCHCPIDKSKKIDEHAALALV